MTDILVSIDQKFVDRILSGNKKAELRRRPVNVAPGARVWIYCKAPKGSVVAFATVKEVFAGSPGEIWTKLGDKVGVSEMEFNEYYNGASSACAIVFSEVFALSCALSLMQIRKKLGAFHPPQFFKRLEHGSPMLQLFESSAYGNA